MRKNRRSLMSLFEAGKYENPVTSKEEALAEMVASYFREDMEDIYHNISKQEFDAAENDLYQALIDVGALHGKEMETAHTGDYDKLLIDIETKLREREYSGGYGRGDLDDPLTDDDISLSDQAAADRVMGMPDSSLKGTPDYDESYKDLNEARRTREYNPLRNVQLAVTDFLSGNQRNLGIRATGKNEAEVARGLYVGMTQIIEAVFTPASKGGHFAIESLSPAAFYKHASSVYSALDRNPGYGEMEDQWSPDHSPEAVQKEREDEEIDYSDEYKEMISSGRPYDKLNEAFGRDSIKDFFKKYSY